MPKRIYLTLSDKAVAVLAALPLHTRGAYVSALIESDDGRAVERPGRRCKCGLELPAVLYFKNGMWAASEDDLKTYRVRQPAHDVIASTGKRLRLGTCKPTE